MLKQATVKCMLQMVFEKEMPSCGPVWTAAASPTGRGPIGLDVFLSFLFLFLRSKKKGDEIETEIMWYLESGSDTRRYDRLALPPTEYIQYI